MCEGLGYDEAGIERLREEMNDEEGKYQVFNVIVGRQAWKEDQLIVYEQRMKTYGRNICCKR